jgi:hypothetical protein
VHCVQNFHARYDDGRDKAICHWFLMLYDRRRQAGPADAPADPDRVHDDRCVRDREGGWLLAHRKFENWFEGGTPTTNPNLDDK